MTLNRNTSLHPLYIINISGVRWSCEWTLTHIMIHKSNVRTGWQMISPVLVSRRCSATVQFKCNNKRVFIRRLHLIRARSSSPPVISSIYFVRVRRRSSTKEFAPLLSHVQRGQSTIILVLREGSRLSSSLTRQSCCSLWFTNHKRRFFCPRERQP